MAESGGKPMIKRSFMTTIALLLVLLLLGFGAPLEAHGLATSSLQITASVPVVQTITVIEPVVATFNYPWSGSEQGQALVLRGIGSILVKSNSNWTLTIGVLQGCGFDVFIRPAENRWSQWVPLTDSTAVYQGTAGSRLSSWDMKIETRRDGNYERGEQMIPFVFTISHR